jgi:mannose-6-phosphate isomerase-like protein (cupin superfamily)
LEGSLGVEVEGVTITVIKDAMLEIPPLEKYRTVSVGKDGCKFVVIGNHNDDDRVFV